jgi:FkbM family methyltransferase
MQPHAREVLEGVYDIPGLDIDGVVLDLGANVGAFSLWALSRWPKCEVVAFEPHPGNADMWRANLADERRRAVIDERAVYNAMGEVSLYPGGPNCGCASLWCGPEQQEESSAITVRMLDAGELGRAQFLKLDTEGAERVILQRYRHLDDVRGVALEWHSQSDRVEIARLLSGAGFALVGDAVHHPIRGVQRWKRS